MQSFPLVALALAALVMAAPAEPTPPDNPLREPPSFDLMRAVHESNVAEIYILRRDIEFVVAPRPDTVRALGCGYRVRRNSHAWEELEKTLGDADIRIEPTDADSEVRIGLVLGDPRGTLFEVYSRWHWGSEARVTGFSQRRQVEISVSFVSTLRDFAERHPELALPDPGPMRRCPHEARQ